jgi:hypothetical protein
MDAAGKALNYVPREVLHWNAADDRTSCCAAAECFGLCYLVDVCGAVPTMMAFEDGINQQSLPLFAFYEACWPCMRLLSCCFRVSHATARQVPRAFPLLAENTFDKIVYRDVQFDNGQR